MGLFLLNISVDTVDPYPNFIPEDLSINDQESIIEMVVEKGLGYEDAFKEYDDHDTEDHSKKTNVKIDFFSNFFTYDVIKYTSGISERHNFLDYNSVLINGFQKLDIPPPKV